MEYELTNPSNPVMFLDISVTGKIVGRVLIEVCILKYVPEVNNSSLPM
jgi:hypothetical protein